MGNNNVMKLGRMMYVDEGKMDKIKIMWSFKPTDGKPQFLSDCNYNFNAW